MTKAYLIDSKARQVTEVDFDEFRLMQEAVGGELGPVYVEKCLFRWLPDDCILVDEEARVRNNPLSYGFAINGKSPFLGGDQIVGNGLVLAAKPTQDGGWLPPVISLEALRAMVTWWGE